MATRKPSTPAPTAVSLTNDRTAIESIQSAVLDAADKLGYPKASRFAIKLAMEEAIVNAFRHGHKDLPAETPITVEYAVGPAEIRIGIEDRGPGFRPEALPDPTLDENLEHTSGRGVMLIRAYMSKVAFNRRGNRVEMIYVKPRGG